MIVMSLTIVMVALAVFVGSATLAACTTTVAGTGSDCGAVKTPLAEIVPTVEFPPGIPATVQITPTFVAFETVGVKVIVFPNNTDPVPGVTLTDMESDVEGASARPTQTASRDRCRQCGSAIAVRPWPGRSSSVRCRFRDW